MDTECSDLAHYRDTGSIPVPVSSIGAAVASGSAGEP